MATDAAGERHVRLAAPAREVKRRVGPTAWAVLEDVALDASLDDAGRLVSTTSSRRVADNLGMTPGTAARALARLRGLGLVSYTRQAGAAGRFGLSAYVLGPVPGLVIVDAADTPAVARRRPVPPRTARPHIDGPPAVDAHMVGEPSGCAGADVFPRSLPDDVGAGAADAVADLATEKRAHSGGVGQPDRRGRRRAPKPVVAQLSILDATLDSALDDPTRHR